MLVYPSTFFSWSLYMSFCLYIFISVYLCICYASFYFLLRLSLLLHMCFYIKYLHYLIHVQYTHTHTSIWLVIKFLLFNSFLNRPLGAKLEVPRQTNIINKFHSLFWIASIYIFVFSTSWFTIPNDVNVQIRTQTWHRVYLAKSEVESKNSRQHSVT